MTVSLLRVVCMPKAVAFYNWLERGFTAQLSTEWVAQVFQRSLENSGESVKTCISLADSDAMPQFLTAAAILPRFLSPTFRETRYGLGCQLRMLLAVLDHGSGREAQPKSFQDWHRRITAQLCCASFAPFVSCMPEGGFR